MSEIRKKSKLYITLFVVNIVSVMILGIIAAKLVIEDKKDDRIGSKYQNQYVEMEQITKKDIQYLKDDGQTIEIDRFTITLEKYCYEEDVKRGYCLISIMEEGKAGKDIFCFKSMRLCFLFGGTRIEDAPFYIDFVEKLVSGGGVALGYKSEKMSAMKDKLYLYFEFYSEKNSFKDMIVVRTNEESSGYDTENLGVGTFKLEDNVSRRVFTDGTNSVSVCTYSVEINDGQEKDIRDLIVHMKNGRKHIIQEGDMEEEDMENGSIITQLRFAEKINIDNIDYIEWKGKKLEEKTS